MVAVVFVPAGAAANLPAVGAASPSSVQVGGSTLLTVTVTPAEGSTGIGVVCNLAPIGGGMTLLHDDGTNGDVTPGDLTFSELATVAAGTQPGPVGIFCVVNDEEGGTGFATISLTITPATPVNEPPTVEAGGPYTVNEGDSTLLTAGGVDPESGPLTYAWDLDDNGTFETAGQTVTFSADDGPATATVHVMVTDDGGLTAVGDATVTISNVPPSATFAAPASASAGVPFMLSLSSPYDPSAADTAAGFTYAFDCGDGYGAFASSPEASCTATDVGPNAVAAMIRDKDGDTTEYKATVDVGVTFDGLCALTEMYSSKPEISHALCVKLHKAAAALDPAVRDGHLVAYENQVDGQTGDGKAFTEEHAAILKRLADGLRT
jgi:hypothetical protein